MITYTLTDNTTGGTLDFVTASDLAIAISDNFPDYIWLVIGEPGLEEPINNPKTQERIDLLYDCLNEMFWNMAIGEQVVIFGYTITRVAK